MSTNKGADVPVGDKAGGDRPRSGARDKGNKESIMSDTLQNDNKSASRRPDIRVGREAENDRPENKIPEKVERHCRSRSGSRASREDNDKNSNRSSKHQDSTQSHQRA